MFRRLFLVLGTLLVSPSVLLAQTTVLMLHSEPGDFVGAGLDQTFTEADGMYGEPERQRRCQH